MMFSLNRICAFIACLSLLLGCGEPVVESTHKGKSVIELPLKYAKGFSIEEKNGNYLLSLFRPTQYTHDTLKFLLEENENHSFSAPHKIQIPVKSFVINSSTHAALLKFCGLDSLVIGVSQPEYICNEQIHKNLEKGSAKVSGSFSKLDEEVLLFLQPEVILAVGFDADKITSYNRMEELGVPYLIISEWLETHPLGRLEWVKILGALSGKYQEVEAHFLEVVEQYQGLAKLIAENKELEHPTVMTALPFKDVWHMPGGTSYMCQLISDAGGDYMYSKETGQGSLHMDFESVFAKCQNTDIWLVNAAVDSKADITGKDERFALFQAFKGSVYNNNAAKCNLTKSNLFWEEGTIEPHLILKDYISIFHPQLFPNYKPKYHLLLPEES